MSSAKDRLSGLLGHLIPSSSSSASSTPNTQGPSTALRENNNNKVNFHTLSPAYFLQRSAAIEPDAEAIYHITSDGQELRRTYLEFADRARGLAYFLKKRGFKRVGILCPNTPAFLESIFGIGAAGAVNIAVNYRLKEDDIAYIFTHSEAEVIIVDKEFLPLLRVYREAKPEIPIIVDTDTDAAEGQLSGPFDEAVLEGLKYDIATGDKGWEGLESQAGSEDDVIALAYTSGTTSRPKGVEYTNRGAYLAALGNVVESGLNVFNGRCRYLWILPMFHAVGWTFPWAVTAARGTHYCLRKVDYGQIWKLFKTEGITHFNAAPTVNTLLCNHPNAERLSTPVIVQVAGSPPTPHLFEQMTSLNLRPVHVYGMTETYGPTTRCYMLPAWDQLPRDEKFRRMARQGHGFLTSLPTRVIKTDVPEGTIIDVKRDGKEIGEIAFVGNICAQGYYKDAEATRKLFAGGVLHSGDLAVWHPDGAIQILDRAKDIIISGGENISSVALESMLVTHPDILEVGVVAVPDTHWGERPKAFVTTKQGRHLEGKEVIDWARNQSQISKFMLPREVEVVAELPKTTFHIHGERNQDATEHDQGSVPAHLIPIPTAVPMPRQRQPARFSSEAPSESSTSSTSPDRTADEDTDFFTAQANDSQSSVGVATRDAHPHHDTDLDLPPIGRLPPEILIAIFAKLSSPSDMLSCMRVCRGWAANCVGILWHRPSCNNWDNMKSITASVGKSDSFFPYSQLIRRLNLSALTDDVSDGTVVPFAQCNRIERLTLTNCSKLTDKGVSDLVEGNRHLQALDVSDLRHLTDHTLYTIARNCARLQGLNITGCVNVTDDSLITVSRNCRQIKRLKLNGVTQVTDKAIMSFAQSCPAILEIDLHDCKLVTNPSVTSLMTTLQNLRELRLAHCTEIDDTAFLELPRQLSMDSLRILDLTSCESVRDDAVERIVAAAPRLRNLVLAKCRFITDRAVWAICRLGKNLHYVHLGHCSNITDAAVIQLVKSCNRIRYIDLACCIRLTDTSVQQLATLPKLRRIGLVKCQNITDNSIRALAGSKAAHHSGGVSSLERVHLSYCVRLTIEGIHALLNSCPRLTHLSLTGVQAFLREELTVFCREAPSEFTHQQREVFCVFSGEGVNRLRDFLNRIIPPPPPTRDMTEATMYDDDEELEDEENQVTGLMHATAATAIHDDDYIDIGHTHG
ncbi:SCF E3 ubiquitin ligase complex F-box protein grrA [Aspergillus awamori]|nr:SCF E3 ubiquitin ligase complex F-box protein grrA [Aspergillus awamori]